jgi:hypothetical protein
MSDIKLSDLTTAIIGAATKLDPTQWSQLAEDKQNDLKQRLEAVRDSLFGVVHTTAPKNQIISCTTTTVRIGLLSS